MRPKTVEVGDIYYVFLHVQNAVTARELEDARKIGRALIFPHFRQITACLEINRRLNES